MCNGAAVYRRRVTGTLDDSEHEHGVWTCPWILLLDEQYGSWPTTYGSSSYCWTVIERWNEQLFSFLRSLLWEERLFHGREELSAGLLIELIYFTIAFNFATATVRRALFSIFWVCLFSVGSCFFFSSCWFLFCLPDYQFIMKPRTVPSLASVFCHDTSIFPPVRISCTWTASPRDRAQPERKKTWWFFFIHVFLRISCSSRTTWHPSTKG